MRVTLKPFVVKINATVDVTMSSNEFILQLIQLSLKDLGYGNVSDQLDEEVKKRRLQEQRRFLTEQESNQIKAIEWFHCQIKQGNYDAIEKYTENGFRSLNSESKLTGFEDEISLPLLLVGGSEDKKMIMTIVLYLVRRNYLLELLLGDNEDDMIDQDFLVDYLKNRLLPTLDSFQQELQLTVEKNLDLDTEIDLVPNDSHQDAKHKLWHIFNKETLTGLVRSKESQKLLGLVMEFPFLNQESKLKVLNNKHLFFGFTNNLNVNQLTDISLILRENLVNHFLFRIFRFDDKLKSFTTDYNVPPNCIQEIINQACTYQKQQNPFYLPPRTKAEKLLRLSEDHESHLPGKNFNIFNHHFKNQYFSSKLIHNLTNNTNEVWFAKFSPLGKFLATGSGDGKLILYDVVNNFKVIKTLASSSAIDNAAFVPPGTKPTADSKSIIYCCWDPNEEYLVSSCLDTIIRVWHVGKLLEKSKKRSSRSSKEGSNDYKLLSCFTLGENIRSWTCAFLPNPVNGKPRFIVGSPDKVLKLYDVAGNELFDFHGNIYESNFNDESSQDVNMEDAELEEDDNDAEQEETLLGLVDIDSDQDGKKKFKTPVNKKVDKRLKEYFNRVVDFVVSPNGRILVTIDRNNQLQFFNIPLEFNQGATTTRIASIQLGTKVNSCSISNNGKYLLLNVGPEEIQLWDISGFGDGGDVTHFDLPILYRKFYAHNHASSVIRSSFGYLVQETNEEELILSGSHDGFVYVWKLHTGQIITRINAHEGACNMVDWNIMGSRPTRKNSRDYGKLWCSVGDDKNVKIWGPSDWE